MHTYCVPWVAQFTRQLRKFVTKRSATLVGEGMVTDFHHSICSLYVDLVNNPDRSRNYVDHVRQRPILYDGVTEKYRMNRRLSHTETTDGN